MSREISKNGETITYAVRRNRRSKGIRLSVQRDGRVVVTAAPYVSARLIRVFVLKKVAWILQSREHQKSRPLPFLSTGTRQDYVHHKKAALILVLNRLEYFNRHYKLRYSKVSIKNQKTRWGSCSKKGNLNFNYRIILLSPELRDYIIIHELCHLKEFNHSLQFWQLVAECCPNYAALRQGLRIQ